MVKEVHGQNRLDKITRKWWFFVLFVLIQFVPPYASKGYNFPEEWGDVIMHALRYAVVCLYPSLYPVFKLIPIILIFGVLVFRNKVARLFALYVGFSYMLFAIGQSIGISKKYGVAICTVNLIMFTTVAGFWLWEAKVLKNDFSRTKLPIWKYWVVPLAFLAFWYPINLRTGGTDFNPFGLFTNIAGLAFCMMTPVYVGLLTLYWPKVNISALRVTSLVGTIIGLYNMQVNFLMAPRTRWWNGVLHLPLLIISLYGLIISLKRPQTVR